MQRSTTVLKDLCSLAKASGIKSGTIYPSAKVMRLMTDTDRVIFATMYPTIKIETVEDHHAKR